jgi:hypothetical protein
LLGIAKITTVLVHSSEALTFPTVTQALPPVSVIVAEAPANNLTFHPSPTPSRTATQPETIPDPLPTSVHPTALTTLR